MQFLLGARGGAPAWGGASAPSVGCLPLPRQQLSFHLLIDARIVQLANQRCLFRIEHAGKNSSGLGVLLQFPPALPWLASGMGWRFSPDRVAPTRQLRVAVLLTA